MSSFDTAPKPEPKQLAETLERTVRDTARRTLDQLARVVASLAVSLNRLAEMVGGAPATSPEQEPRDGVAPSGETTTAA